MTIMLRTSLVVLLALAWLASGCSASPATGGHDAGGTGRGGAGGMAGAGGTGAAVDAGSDQSCGLTCGVPKEGVTAGATTCQYVLRCAVSGDFTRLGVQVNGLDVPMDPTRTEGWYYTDDSMMVFQLYGQACTDALGGDGGPGSVAIQILC